MQIEWNTKKNQLFFISEMQPTFGEAKVTNKWSKCQIYLGFSECEYFCDAKITNIEKYMSPTTFGVVLLKQNYIKKTVTIHILM